MLNLVLQSVRCTNCGLHHGVYSTDRTFDSGGSEEAMPRRAETIHILKTTVAPRNIALNTQVCPTVPWYLFWSSCERGTASERITHRMRQYAFRIVSSFCASFRRLTNSAHHFAVLRICKSEIFCSWHVRTNSLNHYQERIKIVGLGYQFLINLLSSSETANQTYYRRYNIYNK